MKLTRLRYFFVVLTIISCVAMIFSEEFKIGPEWFWVGLWLGVMMGTLGIILVSLAKTAIWIMKTIRHNGLQH